MNDPTKTVHSSARAIPSGKYPMGRSITSRRRVWKAVAGMDPIAANAARVPRKPMVGLEDLCSSRVNRQESRTKSWSGEEAVRCRKYILVHRMHAHALSRLLTDMFHGKVDQNLEQRELSQASTVYD